MTAQVPVLPDSAPFTAEQRLWLNGFLAGYFSRRPFSAVAPTQPAAGPKPPLRVLYGSQTGTAHLLAQRIATEAASQGWHALVTDAAEFGTIAWQKESNLLIVTSTYGDGDMPDNAQAFWDWLSTDSAVSLAHLRYAVLALGDRNYSEFCGAGRKLDARLEQLGARRVYARADCDVDYEAPAMAWSEGVLKALLAEAPSPELITRAAPTLADPATNGHSSGHATALALFSRANPFPARLVNNLRLSKPGSAKEVRHYQLSLEASGLNYEPGDALGVLPVNCPELVNDILTAVHATGDELIRVGDADMPVADALTRHFDVTKPSSELISAIAERSPDCGLAGLLCSERQFELKNWLWGRGVIDLLHLLPKPMACVELLPLLKKLAPRLYSIASSIKAHPGEVHLTVSVVRYETYGRSRKGVASTFLADRVGDSDCVKIFTQPSHGFKLPSHRDTPVIMVGPGTGIAPFRAFLEERQACGSHGRHWLFFGDQRRATDFLYEEELNAWLSSGHLTRLDLAFSRDQADKIYVQHRMLEQAAELWAWLEEGAHFYICGDASKMAKDVDAALHQVAGLAGGKKPEEAKAWVAKLKSDRRYQRDVY